MRVREIRIFTDTITIWDEDGKSFVVPPLDMFAICDGFENWEEFQSFFKDQIGKGIQHYLIQWAETPWERMLAGCPKIKRQRLGANYESV
jgi:hypothetical protein